MSTDPIDEYVQRLRRRRWARRDDDRLIAEVEDHLRAAARTLEAERGMDSEAAEREAVARFGNPHHLRLRLLDPTLVVLAVALTTAIVTLIAGVVAWDMRFAIPTCPPKTICYLAPPSDGHLHPLRAEILWAASALGLTVSAMSALLHLRGRRVTSHR
jgi:hypothetical protein